MDQESLAEGSISPEYISIHSSDPALSETNGEERSPREMSENSSSRTRKKPKSALKPAKERPKPPLTDESNRTRRLVFREVLEEHSILKNFWDYPREKQSAEYVEAAYFASCQLASVQPNDSIIKQIRELSKLAQMDQRTFYLEQPASLKEMDAIESIFRHFQMNTVDVQRKLNDDASATALFDMLLFYESTSLLNCSRNTMGASAWISLSQLVKRSERLHTLNASYNHIPDAVIPPFSRALRSSLNLSVLHLEGCHLTGRSIALICAGLRTNQTLTELHLMDNKLTIPDTQHIRALLTLSKTLTLLDLRNNQIQDSGLFHLCDGLKHANCKLETLCLWNNQLTAVAMAPLTEALLENKTLSMLNLGQNAIMDQGASTLKMGLQGNSTLRRLGLVGCKLSDCGVIAIAEYLAESSAIQRLDLRNNDISLGGLMALSLSARENKSAKRIDLDKPAKDPDLPQELLQRQNELWDDLGLYAMRNRGAEMTRTMSEATVTSPAAQNGEHQTIEFDYRDEPTQLCTKPIPISPKQALDELDVEKSLPPASPPKDEEGSLPLESEENPLDLHVSRDEVDTHEKFDVQSEGLSE